MMLSDVPNMAFAFGYVNQSWTLGADLSAEQARRSLDHMDRNGYARCTPRARDATVAPAPFAFGALTSGYVQTGHRQVPAGGEPGSVAPPAELRAEPAGDAPGPRRRSRAGVLGGVCAGARAGAPRAAARAGAPRAAGRGSSAAS
jgi:hypothetical protein